MIANKHPYMSEQRSKQFDYNFGFRSPISVESLTATCNSEVQAKDEHKKLCDSFHSFENEKEEQEKKDNKVDIEMKGKDKEEVGKKEHGIRKEEVKEKQDVISETSS